jgi:hypothetical protein
MDSKKDYKSTASILKCSHGAVLFGKYMKRRNHMGDLIKDGNIILK